MLGLRGALLVLAVMMWGCTDERLSAREKEVAEAEKQLAELEALRTRLLAEKQDLEQKAQKAEASARAAEADFQQALAAAAWVASEEGKALSLTDEMREARLAFELKQALAAGDSQTIDERMTEATRPSWECAPPESKESSSCPEPPDACKDVPEQVTLHPAWSCERVPHDTPPLEVFCTATAGYNPTSERSVEGTSTKVDLVRVAFVDEGKVSVSDFDLSEADFVSANVYARDSCYRENQGRSCMQLCCQNEDDPEFECDCLTDSPLYMGLPTIEVTRTLVRSPVHGVFVIREEETVSTYRETTRSTPLIRVLADESRLVLPASAPVLERGLVVIAEFPEQAPDTEPSEAPEDGGLASGNQAQVAWTRLPDSRREVLMGFRAEALQGLSFNPEPGEDEQVIEDLAPGELCALILKEPSQFPPAFSAWCAEHPETLDGGSSASDAGGAP